MIIDSYDINSEPIVKLENFYGEKIAKVREVYDRLNLPERIHELISAYIDTAIKCLDHLELGPEARAFFMDLALKSASRDK